MILRGGRVATGAATTAELDLGIADGRIRMEGPGAPGPEIDCRGQLILPGLINAHDHLEFNLFPRLGSGPYPSAAAWAGDIYRPNEAPVSTHLTVPKDTRLVWGALKNLVCGVTTVMHHNPYEPLFDSAAFPVRVARGFGWAHSLFFSTDVVERYRATPPELPFFIHAAEGTDSGALEEVRLLDALGVLARNTVLVHAVGLDEPGWDLVRRRGAAVVWCPTSNRFTLGRTLPTDALDGGVPVALGTDSALTAAGDLSDELAAAAGPVSWNRLYSMITTEAARILRLHDSEGEIRDGGVADLLLVRDRGQTPAQALRDLCPELVLLAGEPKLASCDAKWAALLPEGGRLEIAGRGAWLAACDVASLRESACRALGAEPRLAGRQVSA